MRSPEKSRVSSHGGGAIWRLLHPYHHQEDCLLSVLQLVGDWGLCSAFLKESQDFSPPGHYTTSHSSCGSASPVFNFSPLIPAIIILEIIYGVLTEGLATLLIKRCCNTCLPAVGAAPTSSFCSGRFWKTAQFPAWFWIGVSRAVFPRRKTMCYLQHNQFWSYKNRCWGSIPHLLSQNLSVPWGSVV